MSCKSEKTNSELKSRLNRIEGQIRGIKKMIEDERGCIEVMNQLLSASSAIRGVWEIIAAHHLQECVSECGSKAERNEAVSEIISQIQKLR